MFATTKLAAAGARIGDFYDETLFLQALTAIALPVCRPRSGEFARSPYSTPDRGMRAFLALGLVRIGDENHLL
jgi:hypothetical protein